MLSVERVKELINDPNLSEKEIEEIRDGLFMLAEVMFEQWQAERIKAKKEKEDKDKEEKKESKGEVTADRSHVDTGHRKVVAKGGTGEREGHGSGGGESRGGSSFEKKSFPIL